jgi:hypothetical protein
MSFKGSVAIGIQVILSKSPHHYLQHMKRRSSARKRTIAQLVITLVLWMAVAAAAAAVEGLLHVALLLEVRECVLIKSLLTIVD